MKKIIAIAFATLALVACKTENPSVTNVTLDHDALNIQVGETAELHATIEPAGVNAAITWESSNPAIATVVDGIVTGIAAGPAYIIATADGHSARCRVTVFEEGQTVISLNKLAIELEKDSTYQLIATVEPAEKASELRWTSDNTLVATVSETGLITAVAAGHAKITASIGDVNAECQVTVKNSGSQGGEKINHPSLEGTEYYVFQIGGKAGEQIADRIVVDFREDKAQKNFYIWPDTGDSYIAGETSGKNFYGEAEGWVSLTVGSIGWSGFGYNCADFNELNKLAKIMETPSDYYLHIAMKSIDNASHLLFMDGTTGSAHVCIGATAFVDNGTTYQPMANFTRNGEWGEIEICMSDLFSQGLVFGNNNTKALNVFGFLSGGQTGVMLQFDAAFIYKKAAAN